MAEETTSPSDTMTAANTIDIGILPALMSAHSSMSLVENVKSFKAMTIPIPIATEPTMAQPNVIAYAVKMLVPMMMTR